MKNEHKITDDISPKESVTGMGIFVLNSFICILFSLPYSFYSMFPTFIVFAYLLMRLALIFSYRLWKGFNIIFRS